MAWDSIWDEVFKEGEWGKYPDENLIRFIAKTYYSSLDRKKINILEVGCGPGANLLYLTREGFKTHGVDGSKEAVKIAKERFSSEQLEVELQVCDIALLPFPENYFDCVVDMECLYANSFYNTKIILKEIYRITKKEGLLFSKSITDKMYLGRDRKKVGPMEYTNISDGPVAGKGFARTMTKDEIFKLYGELFTIESIDLHEYTRNNQSMLNSEWVIICSKK